MNRRQALISAATLALGVVVSRRASGHRLLLTADLSTFKGEQRFNRSVRQRVKAV
jgi:hypothetical protein